jgi:hypothetical protein
MVQGYRICLYQISTSYGTQPTRFPNYLSSQILLTVAPTLIKLIRGWSLLQAEEQ